MKIGTDEELKQFANDVYDVLMGNTHFCTQSQFTEKYDADNIEFNCSINHIVIGDFRIEIYRNS